MFKQTNQCFITRFIHFSGINHQWFTSWLSHWDRRVFEPLSVQILGLNKCAVVFNFIKCKCFGLQKPKAHMYFSSPEPLKSTMMLLWYLYFDQMHCIPRHCFPTEVQTKGNSNEQGITTIRWDCKLRTQFLFRFQRLLKTKKLFFSVYPT